MIQRIQSVWLLLAAAAAFLSLKFSFYSGNIIRAGQPQKWEELTAQSNILLLILSVLVGLLALITIFLYKDRKLQMKLLFAGLVVSLLNIFLYFNQIKKFLPGEGTYTFTSALSFIIPILFILALRGVYRDQKLVKSLDRLR